VVDTKIVAARSPIRLASTSIIGALNGQLPENTVVANGFVTGNGRRSRSLAMASLQVPPKGDPGMKKPGAGGPRVNNCRSGDHGSWRSAVVRLLPSGLYRRLRSFTGSCVRAPTRACGLYRRSGLDHHNSVISPNPEG
jgi:hypothetical protein